MNDAPGTSPSPTAPPLSVELDQPYPVAKGRAMGQQMAAMYVAMCEHGMEPEDAKDLTRDWLFTTATHECGDES